MTHTELDTAALASTGQLRKWLASFDRVLIGAGAGLSAAAGIDYTAPASFAQRFPALVRRGFRASYELIGCDDWSPTEKWGYWTTHVNLVRFGHRPHPVYAKLLGLVRNKDYFVLTSNIDDMFVRNGFDKDRISTPQGDYAAMQCAKPCRRLVWPSRPSIEQLLSAIDPATQAITDPDLIPKCPFCDGEVFLNVRGGSWFVGEVYDWQLTRFRRWLYGSLIHPVLVLEIGAGFSTPAVVRWPLEELARFNPKARYVRVNLEHAEVPSHLASRALSFRSDALQLIKTISQDT